MNYFIIFEFLSLEYGKTDAKIVYLSNLSEKIKEVMGIVKSQSLARSRASGTSFPSLFSSSSTSNILKSTPRLN